MIGIQRVFHGEFPVAPEAVLDGQHTLQVVLVERPGIGGHLADPCRKVPPPGRDGQTPVPGSRRPQPDGAHNRPSACPGSSRPCKVHLQDCRAGHTPNGDRDRRSSGQRCPDLRTAAHPGAGRGCGKAHSRPSCPLSTTKGVQAHLCADVIAGDLVLADSADVVPAPAEDLLLLTLKPGLGQIGIPRHQPIGIVKVPSPADLLPAVPFSHRFPEGQNLRAL